MKWIRYEYVCGTDTSGNNILAQKKMGYNEKNLAIAEAEALGGYEIVEDDKVIEKEPLGTEFGGTGAETSRGAEYNISGDVNESTEPVSENHYFVFKHSSPSKENGAFVIKKVSRVWDYFAYKIRNIFGFTTSNVLGIKNGGTDATNAADARNKLGITPANIGAAPTYHDHYRLIVDGNSGDVIAAPEAYAEKGEWIGWGWSGTYSDNDATRIAMSFRLNKDTGRLATRIDSKAGTGFPHIYTSDDKPSAAEIGALDASDIAGTQKNVLTSQAITATTNILTLANGYYHHEGNISKTYNWPWEDTSGRAELIVQGHRPGTNGWWYVVAINYNTGHMYINMRRWDKWSGWQQFNMTNV